MPCIQEGDIFSCLRESGIVVRSFESSSADGCITLEPEFDANHDYLQRLFLMQQFKAARIIPFDVKSTMGHRAGSQRWYGSTRQQQIVAFYIGVYAADPSWVDVIPNLQQVAEGQVTFIDADAGRVRHDIAPGRRLPLRPVCYRLEPTRVAYRMPRALLGKAMQRIKDCIVNGAVYRNPFSGVSFPAWRPHVYTSVDYLLPSEHGVIFTSYKAIMDLQRQVLAHKNLGRCLFTLDLTGVQPRLCDFKLVWPGNKQALVQHKMDTRPRLYGSALGDVDIAREQANGSFHYYFNQHDRFDYIMYQIDFVAPDGFGRQFDIFFLPEVVIPDYFFTTTDTVASFDHSAFAPFRIRPHDDLVARIGQITAQHSQPRKQMRPGRVPRLETNPQIEQVDDVIDESANAGSDGEIVAKKSPATVDFYQNVMVQCAQNGSGVLLVQRMNQTSSELLYCRYNWSASQRQDFYRTARPPVYLHELPGPTPVLPVFYTCKQPAGHASDLGLTPAQHVRVEPGFSQLLVSVEPSDELDLPIIVIPSDDVDFVQNPVPAARVQNGRNVGCYAIGSSGALALSNDARAFAKLWRLLEQFSGDISFEHPSGCERRPSDYRVSMQQMSERVIRGI